MAFDVAAVQTLVGTVGFPIVAFGVCAWFLKYTWDKSQEQSNKTAEELTKLTNAVNNNTASLTVLANMITERKIANESAENQPARVQHQRSAAER